VRVLCFTPALPLLACSVLACSVEERAPPAPARSSDGGAAGAGSGVGDPDGDDDCEELPPIDTSRLCTNEVVPVVQSRPNLYFVVDTSGSMADLLEVPDGPSKIAAAQDALVNVATELGHRVNYGLAAYPGPIDGAPAPGLEGCAPGAELFETQEGDPLSCANKRGGPVLEDFTQVVLDLYAMGGTPLSATLEAVAPAVMGLDGTTVLLLMTDGAPNCNPEASCTAALCMPNIEGADLPSGRCDETINCCDSDELSEEDLIALGGYPEASCVDDAASVEALADLERAGIKTYVVGVPGSEIYRDTMNALAVAGGTARDGDVAYYDVRDLEGLNEALLQIGAEVAQSCTIELDEAPPNPDFVNVYFDRALLPADPDNGWSIEGATVTLHGDACDDVRGGAVTEVQVVAGCWTVVR
jgi:hypothetical protein